MAMPAYVFSSLLLVFNLGIRVTQGYSSELKCGACLAIVDEVMHGISLIDPNELIQVGSFRIDPQGNQKLNKIPLKKSELKMMEILENVCKYMNSYGMTNSDSGSKIFMRMTSPEGNPCDKVIMSLVNPQRFVDVCLELIDDYQEDMITVFKQEEELYEKLCIDTCDACNARNVTEFEDHKLNVRCLSRADRPVSREL